MDIVHFEEEEKIMSKNYQCNYFHDFGLLGLPSREKSDQEYKKIICKQIGK